MYIMQEKPDTHDTYTSRVSPGRPHIRFLWAVPVRDNFSLCPIASDGYYYSLEKVCPTTPLSLAEWPVGLAPVSLHLSTIEAVGLSRTSIK
jgi:hypothetical protein